MTWLRPETSHNRDRDRRSHRYRHISFLWSVPTADTRVITFIHTRSRKAANFEEDRLGNTLFLCVLDNYP